MEIKVGEYVRNKYGIAKVINIEKKDGIEVLIFDRNICFWVDKKTGEIKDDILFNKLALIEGVNIKKIKHSNNTTDLIEVGDYVNGYKVLEIRRNDNRILIGVYKDTETVIYKTLTNENVKTILTHEQYEQNAYRLEEKE